MIRRGSARFALAALFWSVCSSALVGIEEPDAPAAAAQEALERTEAADQRPPQVTLFVTPQSAGRWAAWVQRGAERVPVEIPQERDEIIRFAELQGYRVHWHVEGGETAAHGPSAPSDKPLETAAAGSPKKPAGKPVAPRTKAERITLLQRQIETDRAELQKLQGQINDPMSDYERAQTIFQSVDAELQQRKKELKELAGSGDQERVEATKSAVADLESRWKLAREWFDVAIQTRETLQAKVAVTEQKLKQDQQALERLTAPEASSTPRPSASGESKSAAQDQSPAAPSPGPANPEPNAEQPSTTPLAAGPVAAVLQPVNPQATQVNEEVSPELLQAKTVADQTEKAAKEAEEEAASVSDRLKVLDQSIELQNRLLAAARKRRDIADGARRHFEAEYRSKSLEGAPRAELQELADKLNRLEQRFGELGDEVRTSAALLDQLQTERAALQAQQLEALQLAESKRKEAAAAEGVVEQLQNPFTPRNILQWLIDHTPRLLAILAGMFLLRWAARFFSRRIVRIMTRSGARGSREEREDRAKTLMGVVHSAASLAIIVGGILMACDEIGIAVTPLVGGAAVLGLAVAFGAQNLIRDYFYGFTILLENQYKINDVVKIGDTSGQVERITLRITVLRDLEGCVHFIPNGKIDSVTNMTHGWSRALFEIRVAYREDADYVMGVLLELARELRADPHFGPLILDEPEMLGVDSLGESSFHIKFILKTRPLKQWAVKRELLRRIKRRFDELGIEIPFPHRTVYHRGAESGERSTDQPQSGADQVAWASRKSA